MWILHKIKKQLIIVINFHLVREKINLIYKSSIELITITVIIFLYCLFSAFNDNALYVYCCAPSEHREGESVNSFPMRSRQHDCDWKDYDNVIFRHSYIHSYCVICFLASVYF